MRWLPLLLILLATGCGSDRGAVILQIGRVGSLRMDRSTRADVIAFAGRPEAERHGAEGIGPGSQPFDAIGYGCSTRHEDEAFGLAYPPNGRAGPFCDTVFWINRRTGRLGDFYTTSGSYSESHGVRIGMPTARAEKLVHKLVFVGCEENIYLGRGDRTLTIAFDGGSPRKLSGSSGLHLMGATSTPSRSTAVAAMSASSTVSRGS